MDKTQNRKTINSTGIRLYQRSQIQMTESIAILFVFFILLIFGFVFYTNIMRGSTKVELEENIQLKAIGTAQKASFLPELQCSEENVRTENCIDILKLEAASEDEYKDKNSLYYYDIFEFSSISVKQIFPEPAQPSPQIIILYEKEPPDYTTTMSTFIPVSLFDPENKKYAFGILTVEVYKK